MLEIDKSKCVACGGCVGVCPFSALNLDQGRDLQIDHEKCTECGICVRFCPVGALKLGGKNDNYNKNK